MSPELPSQKALGEMDLNTTSIGSSFDFFAKARTTLLKKAKPIRRGSVLFLSYSQGRTIMSVNFHLSRDEIKACWCAMRDRHLLGFGRRGILFEINGEDLHGQP